MVLLTVNLVVCSLNRLPSSLRLYRRKAGPRPPRDSTRICHPIGFLSPKGASKTRTREDGARPGEVRSESAERKKTDQAAYLWGNRGAWSYFGVYVIHAGVLVIILGAVIGSILGFDGNVNIPEGGSADRIELRGGKGVMELGFSVMCDKFDVEFYDSGMPKLYKSDLSFLTGRSDPGPGLAHGEPSAGV